MVSLRRLVLVLALFVLYLVAIIYLFDRTDNTPLYLVLLFGGVLALFAALASGLLVPGKAKRLLAEGEEAPAVVLAIADTGFTLNKSPYVKLLLRVEPRMAPAYEKAVHVFVSRLAIPRVGDVVSVRFDPFKPDDLVVVP